MIEQGSIYVCEVCGHRWLGGATVPGRCARSSCKARGWNAAGAVDVSIPGRAALIAELEALRAEVALLKRELAKRPAPVPGGAGKLGATIEDVQALDAVGPSISFGKGKASSARGLRAARSGQAEFCEHNAARRLCRYQACRVR